VAAELRLQSLRDRLVPVAPIRLGLGVLFFVAARLAGAESAPALTAFAVGGLGFCMAVLADPRRAFAARHDPLPVPDDATYETVTRSAVAALYPSTLAVAALATVTLLRDPVLSALLAGGLLGMGIATVVSIARLGETETRLGGRVWVDPRTQALYLRPPP
jgi:hypothetical protein